MGEAGRRAAERRRDDVIRKKGRCGAPSFVPVDCNCGMELFRLPHLRIRKTGPSPKPYIFFLRALAR